MYFVGFEKLSLTLAIHRIGGNQNSKTLLTIYELGSKITRNSVFHCNLSPTGDIMAIENSVYDDFLSTSVDSIYTFDCRLYSVL